MMENIRIALVVVLILVANLGFCDYMQTNPTLCDSVGYPVCTGSPDD